MVERVHHPREAIEHIVRYAHGGLRFMILATHTRLGWFRLACQSTTCPRSWDTCEPPRRWTGTPTPY
ncbi:MAG: hypothetical protein QOH09_4679 [Pseudonocardiales bacterium]|jgi:hypothetical protein|nr:hypothetical protein [Pseudonocardiales bacterium]